MENCLFTLLIWLLVSVAALWTYWCVFYPAIILKARFKLLSIQDDVRLVARSNGKLAASRAYAEFEHFLSISHRVVQHHDVVGLYYRHPQDYEIQGMAQRFHTVLSEDVLADKFKELTRWMIVVQMVSAPPYLLVTVVLVVLSLFSDWAKAQTDRKEKEAFTLAEALPA